MESNVIIISSESDSTSCNSPPVKKSYFDDGLRLGRGLELGLHNEDAYDDVDLNNSFHKQKNYWFGDCSPNEGEQNCKDNISSDIPERNRAVHDLSCSESSCDDLGEISPRISLHKEECNRRSPKPGITRHNLSDENDDTLDLDIRLPVEDEADSSIGNWSGSSPHPHSTEDQSRPNRLNIGRVLHELSDEDNDILDLDRSLSDNDSGPGVKDLVGISPQLNSDEDIGSTTLVPKDCSDEDDTIKMLGEDVALEHDSSIDLSPKQQSWNKSSPSCHSDSEAGFSQVYSENSQLNETLSKLFGNVAHSRYSVKPIINTNLVQKSKQTRSKSVAKKSSAEEKRLAAKLRKEEREALRAKKLAEKAKIKAAKLALTKARQLLKPEECIKYLTVILDNNIFELSLGGNLYNELETLGVAYNVESQLIPHSVSWVRKNPESGSGTSLQHEQHSLLIIPSDQLAKLIKEQELPSYVKGVQAIAPNKSFTLILFGTETMFRPNKKKGAEEYKISREELTEALVEVQLFTNSNHRFVENCLDLATTISQFSKAVAEIPFRLERQKLEQNKLEWFGESDSRDCVRVDKNGNGLLRLWRQQLCEFNLAGLHIAEAITAIYPSPQALFQAYDRCSTQSEKEKMLQDIQIRRGVGPLTSARRIGPELSKKLHTFFTTFDGDIELSTE